MYNTCNWPVISTLLATFMCFVALLPPVAHLQRSPQPRPPPDKFDCKLNASSPFSFIVRIWDDHKKVLGRNWEPGPVSFGSIISIRAVLSSAWYYAREMKSPKFPNSGGLSRFTVVGQNIWDYTSNTGYKNPCYQENKIADIKLHPKSGEEGERMYFDYSVIVLTAPFKTSTPYFPSMPFSTNPLELLLQIRYVNVIGGPGACAMPTPSRIPAKYWTFNERIDFLSLPFHTRCIQYLCEQVGSDDWYIPCERKFNKRLNATLLCMIPAWIKNVVKLFPQFPTSYSGIPLLCNGTALGISAQVKERVDYPEYKQDIFLVVTLLRVFPWLMERINDNGTSIPTTTVKDDKQVTEFVDYPKPSTISTEDWGQAEFYKLPDVDNPFRPFAHTRSRGSPCCSPSFWKSLMISTFFHSLPLAWG